MPQSPAKKPAEATLALPVSPLQQLLFQMINRCRSGRCDELAQRIRSQLYLAGAALESLVYRERRTLRYRPMDDVMFERIVRYGWQSEARLALKHARPMALVDDVQEEVSYVRECLSEARAKAEDIGSSEKEILALLHQGRIASANNWWQFAVRATSPAQCDESLRQMSALLEKAKATLKEIGLSEADVAAARAKLRRINGVHAA